MLGWWSHAASGRTVAGLTGARLRTFDEGTAKDEEMVKQDPGPNAAPAAPKKPLSPEAQRALAEAEARRQAAGAPKEAAELRGRGGLDPVRYGDWEVKGIASDF
jgi:hypothetical protein